MGNILIKSQPKLLQTDNGTEFYNTYFKNLMQKYKIKHYSTYSNIKAGMVERVIRTVKGKIYKHFSSSGTWNWYNVILKLVNNYNHTKHSTIHCSPNQGRSEPASIKSNTSQIIRKKPKFKINDKVRISKYKHQFSKGYNPNWTTEIFTIYKVLNTNPVTYQLKDNLNNTILGCFYNEEIKKTCYPNTFLINNIIKKQKNKSYVSWLGFDSSHNSWISSSDIVK
jgi:hypothetical protein